jgi:thiosulfate/3-mercaptopyruvate sulfurtransferase
MLVSVSDVDSLRQDAAWRVFDSRAADRYRGENETIDPVAGHIPGAFNAPYAQNADPDGRLLPVTDLRERFRMLLGEILVRNSVFYCGSGVTAAYNLLALEHAGMEGARLYAGSWSEWITNPSRPVAKG